MGTVSYTVVNGRVLSEKRNGVRRQFVPDPLGSTIALLDNTQTKTDTFSYYPYGEEASRTGSTVFRYIGVLGYYCNSKTRYYVRQRDYNCLLARWNTNDPLGTKKIIRLINAAFTHNRLLTQAVNLRSYSHLNPMTVTDPSGLLGVVGVVGGIAALFAALGLCGALGYHKSAPIHDLQSDKVGHCVGVATVTKCMGIVGNVVVGIGVGSRGGVVGGVIMGIVGGAIGALLGCAGALTAGEWNEWFGRVRDPYDTVANKLGCSCGAAPGNISSEDCCWCKVNAAGLPHDQDIPAGPRRDYDPGTRGFYPPDFDRKKCEKCR